MNIKVNVEEARLIAYKDNIDFKMITKDVIDTSRWSIHYEGICEHLESGKYYRINWSVGATESQDEGPFEYDKEDIELTEVEEKEVTVKQWVTVK